MGHHTHGRSLPGVPDKGMAAVPSSGAGDKHDAAASELAVRQLLDRAWNKIGRPNANLQETQAVS